MKIAITFLALLALGYSAPHQRSLFHEHFEDFLDLISEEVGADLEKLAEKYLELEEFQAGINYLNSPKFRNLVYEMEDLPEFKAVVQFLETHNIDILFFINLINDAVDGIQRRSLRQELSGRDMSSFVRDSIDLFPKDKLAALYEKKIAESEEFRLAMEGLASAEWDEVYGALWSSEVFLAEIQELYDNGVDVEVLLLELKVRNCVTEKMQRIVLLLLVCIAASSAHPTERIVGGTITNINTYPYSAALLFARNNIRFRQHCGGSIINNRSFLTAAHCTVGHTDMTRFRIRVGSTSASSGGSVHNIGQRIHHPQYNQGTMNNDIGLLRVTTPFQFGTSVRAAAIIGQNVVIPYNTNVWAIGWGWTSQAGNNPSDQLRHVQIRTINTPRCQSVYTGFPITAGMMCAGWDAGGRGSCQGDSGSPLVHNNVVVGVTSFGMVCASSRYPTVYARVAHFTNWIRNTA